MKNLHVERDKISAKQYHRTHRSDHFQDGIMIFHMYDGLPSSQLSWWDDVTFILNDYRVALTWTHPRMAYEDAIEAEADRQTEDLLLDDFMRKGTPTYKKLGKSRKKITHISYEPRPHSARHERWTEARQQVMSSAHIEIRPSVSAQWCRYSRLISLCAPIEVRNEADLRELVALARRLLKRETTLEVLFPNYRYTRKDWEREGLHMCQDDLHIHSIRA